MWRSKLSLGLWWHPPGEKFPFQNLLKSSTTLEVITFTETYALEKMNAFQKFGLKLDFNP